MFPDPKFCVTSDIRICLQNRDKITTGTFGFHGVKTQISYKDTLQRLVNKVTRPINQLKKKS